jgi:hypothetical protein
MLTPAHFACLEEVKGVAATANHLVKYGKLHGDEVARWAFKQWELRKRGAEKFDRAAEMLFDETGLQMASHRAVAAYHASLFPAGTLVEDLTAGIGADTVALAGRGPVIGFELDAFRAELLRHNLAVYDRTATIRVEDSVVATQADYVFVDPARRKGETRHKSFEDFQPNPNQLVSLLRNRKLAVIKLSPMLPDSVLAELAGEGRVRFVGYGRECREALVIIGTEVSPGWDSVNGEH